jgi:protein TonB
MFETSVVRERVIGAERRMGLVTASVALHSLIIIAAIAVSLTNSGFPNHAPNQSEIFRPIPVVSLPEPLGHPRAAVAQPAAKPAAVHPMQAAPPMNVAPQNVPDAIPQVAAPQSAATDTGGSANVGDDRIGVPWGDPNSVDIGQSHTQQVAPDATGPLYVTGDVKPPVAIHRVEPVYPAALVRAKVSGTVKLLCVIDKEGNVRNPQVISSTFAAFDQSAIDAVQKWRFVAGSLRGRAVDTYFELTVRFTAR